MASPARVLHPEGIADLLARLGVADDPDTAFDIVTTACIENGGTLYRDASDAWVMDLFGIAATGPSPARAIADWQRRARAALPAPQTTGETE